MEEETADLTANPVSSPNRLGHGCAEVYSVLRVTPKLIRELAHEPE